MKELGAVRRLRLLASASFDIDVAAFLKAGIPEDVVQAIHDAVKAFEKPGHDPNGRAYASHMQQSFDMYGVNGVKTQVLYLLINARTWQGEEAKAAKKILKKWGSK